MKRIDLSWAIGKFVKFRIWLILFAVLILEIILLDKNLFWDSALYVAIGKYLFSFGEVGFYELLRPPVFSLLLGFFWFLKLDVFFMGNLLVIVSSLAAIYLTYLVGKNLGGEEVGLFSAFALFASASYIFFSTKILNDVFTVFLVILMFYLLLKGKHPFWVGVVASLAFLTRFPAGLILPAAFVFFFVNALKDGKIKVFLINFFYVCLGFFLLVVPYLIFVQLKFGDFLLPFVEASRTLAIVGESLSEGFFFYPEGFLLESLLVIFVFVGIYFFIRKDRLNPLFWSMIFFVFSMFVYFTYLDHKEFRYLLVMFPCVYLVAAYGVRHFRRYKVWMLVISLFLLAQLVFGLVIYNDAFRPTYDVSIEDYYYAEVNGVTVLSSPQVLAYQDIDAVIIYSIQDDMFGYFEENYHPENYMVNSCELVCSTEECEQYKVDFLSSLDENYDLVFSENFAGCDYLVYM